MEGNESSDQQLVADRNYAKAKGWKLGSDQILVKRRRVGRRRGEKEGGREGG